MKYTACFDPELSTTRRSRMKTAAARSVSSELIGKTDAADGDFLRAMGKRVRETRERRVLSRRAWSEIAEIPERYLAQLEAGEGNASVVLLRRVASSLGVPVTELL